MTTHPLPLIYLFKDNALIPKLHGRSTLLVTQENRQGYLLRLEWMDYFSLVLTSETRTNERKQKL